MEIDEYFKQIKIRFESKQKEVDTVQNLLNETNYKLKELQNKGEIFLDNHKWRLLK